MTPKSNIEIVREALELYSTYKPGGGLAYTALKALSNIAKQLEVAEGMREALKTLISKNRHHDDWTEIRDGIEAIEVYQKSKEAK